MISSIFLEKIFDRRSLLVLVLQTVANLKIISIKIAMHFNVFYQNLIMTNLLLTSAGSVLQSFDSLESVMLLNLLSNEIYG